MEDRAEVEGDGVVEERLPYEQRQAEYRPARISLDRHLCDLPERNRVALTHRDRLARLRQRLPDLLLHLALDLVDYSLGLLLPPVDEQPPGALGHIAANEHDRQAEQSPGAERDPPPD